MNQSGSRLDILSQQPLSGPDAAGAAPEVESPQRRSGKRGRRRPRFPFSASVDWPREQVPRTAGSGAPDRRRRRHGRADRGGRAARAARCPRRRTSSRRRSSSPSTSRYIQAGAELIETNTFGANRAKLAAQFLDDDVERINSDGVKLAREAREISGADVLDRRLDRAARRRRDRRRPRSRLRGAGGGARGARRRPVHGRDVLTSSTELTTAIEAVRSVSSLPIVALLTFDADGETPGGVGAAEAAERAARARRRGMRREPRRRPAGCADGARRDGRRPAARGAAEPRSREPLGQPDRLPARGRRSTSATSRRRRASSARGSSAAAAARRRLQIAAIRDALAEERAVAQPIFTRERAQHTRAIPTHEESRFAAALREGRFTATVEINPPKGGSIDGLLDLCRALRDSGKVELPRRHRQLHGARADEPDDGVGGDRAAGRDRDDPAPDAARQLGDGTRVDPARRARRWTAQRPRDHGRPARRRRLSRLARRLRGRLDRPLPAAPEAERRRVVHRQGARRADVVLLRRRRQPDRRRSRRGAAALRAEARGRRAVRDHAVALRPRIPRRVRAPARRLAGSGAARRLLRHELSARAAAAQRGAGDRRARRGARAVPRRRHRRRAGRASRSRRS